ncbi:hypothetical protein V1517DRAFT_265081 [Lipomyces orientalis]|uniref:Uncharacterized protein n=1 Tax=Lipomyces orientalis TaxID=1233043 RepID=A0ACC3TFY3_9ASCO
MVTSSPSKAVSHRASPDVHHYRKESSPSCRKQPGQASVLIEYFERSTAPHSEQKPSIRVQLRASSKKSPKTMSEDISSDSSLSKPALDANTIELSPTESSPVSDSSEQFDPEDMPSPALRQVESVNISSARAPIDPLSKLSVDSTVSPVFSTSRHISGQDIVSSPATSQTYYSGTSRHIGDENNTSGSSHRSTTFDPDLLDNIISNVIRRLVLPELDSIKLKGSSEAAAALATQTASREVLHAADSADVLDTNTDNVSPKSESPPVPSQEPGAREGDLPQVQRSDYPMDLSKTHILTDSDLEPSKQRQSFDNRSLSDLFELNHIQKESSATAHQADSQTHETSGDGAEDQQTETNTAAQNTPQDGAWSLIRESERHDDSHPVPSSSMHQIDDIGSDGDANYFSSEEYPRPSGVSQSDVDLESELTHVRTNMSASDQAYPVRNFSEFSFESGAEGPLYMSSSAAVQNHDNRHELPTPPTDGPISCCELLQNDDEDDILDARKTRKSSPCGDSQRNQNNSLGIRYMTPDQRYSDAPWLRRGNLDQDLGRNKTRDGNKVTSFSPPIGQGYRTNTSWDELESPIMLQGSGSRVQRSGLHNVSQVEIDNDNRPEGASSSPTTSSGRGGVRGQRQTSRLDRPTPTKPRAKNSRTVKVDQSLPHDFANQYMAALSDRLLAHDIQRTSRDTEILTGVAKLAGEMRMGLEEIRHMIASECQYSRDEINGTIGREIAKLRGPRPYPHIQKTDALVDQPPGQKKNILFKAFGGIKSNSDLERVETL